MYGNSPSAPCDWQGPAEPWLPRPPPRRLWTSRADPSVSSETSQRLWRTERLRSRFDQRHRGLSSPGADVRGSRSQRAERVMMMNDDANVSASSDMPFFDEAIVWASPARPLKADVQVLPASAKPWCEDALASVARAIAMSNGVAASASSSRKSNGDVMVSASSAKQSGDDVMVLASRTEPMSNDVTMWACRAEPVSNNDVMMSAYRAEPMSNNDVMMSAYRAEPMSNNDVMMLASSAEAYLRATSGLTESCSSSGHVGRPVCSSRDAPPARVRVTSSLNVHSMAWEPGNSQSWQPMGAGNPMPLEAQGEYKPELAPPGNSLPSELHSDPLSCHSMLWGPRFNSTPRGSKSKARTRALHDDRTPWTPSKLCDHTKPSESSAVSSPPVPCDITAWRKTVADCLLKVLNEDTEPLESIGDSSPWEPDGNSTPMKSTAKPENMTSPQMSSSARADSPSSSCPHRSPGTPASFPSPQSPESPAEADNPSPIQRQRQVSPEKEPFTNSTATSSPKDDSGCPSLTDQEDSSGGDDDETAGSPGSPPRGPGGKSERPAWVQTESKDPTQPEELRDLQDKHEKLESTCASLRDDILALLGVSQTDQEQECAQLTERLVREQQERLDQELIRRMERVEQGVHHRLDTTFEDLGTTNAELKESLQNALRVTKSEIKDIDNSLRAKAKQFVEQTTLLEKELRSLRVTIASSRSNRRHVTRAVQRITLGMQKAEQDFKISLYLCQRSLADSLAKHEEFCTTKIASVMERQHQLETKMEAEERDRNRAGHVCDRMEQQQQLAANTLVKLKERSAKAAVASGKLTRDAERAERVLLNVESETTEARKYCKSLTDKVERTLGALEKVEEKLAGNNRKWTDLDRKVTDGLSVFSKLEEEARLTDTALRKRMGVLRGMAAGPSHSAAVETLDPALHKQLLIVISGQESLVQKVANLEKWSGDMAHTNRTVRGQLEQSFTNLSQEFHDFSNFVETRKKCMAREIESVRQVISETYDKVIGEKKRAEASK